MLKINVRNRFLVCLLALFLFLAACSEEKEPQSKVLDGIWYLDTGKSLDAMEKNEKREPGDFKAKRIESLRGMMLVFDSGEKKLSIIANEEEREDFTIREIVDEPDSSLIVHLEKEAASLHFRLIGEKILEFESRILGRLVFTSQKPACPKGGIGGAWYLDVEESLKAKPSLSPVKQRDLWLLDGWSFLMAPDEKNMTRIQPGMEPREYVLHKLSENTFASDMDEYGEANLRFFSDGSLGMKLGILPTTLIFSREKPQEYDPEILDGTWRSDPARTRSTHPAGTEAVDSFFIVIDTKAGFIHFIVQDEEKTLPFRFYPQKGKAFHAASEGYGGEILLVPEGENMMKMLSDNLEVVFERRQILERDVSPEFGPIR